MAPGRGASAVLSSPPSTPTFHVHRGVLAALTQARRDAWNRWLQRSKQLGRVLKDARFGLARGRENLEADPVGPGSAQRMACSTR
jgi:hypothetical protein